MQSPTCLLKTRRLADCHRKCFAPRRWRRLLPQPLERVSLTAHGPAKTLTSALSPARNHHDCGVSGISCSLDHRTPFHIISVNNESVHESREIKKPRMSALAFAKKKNRREPNLQVPRAWVRSKDGRLLPRDSCATVELMRASTKNRA